MIGIGNSLFDASNNYNRYMLEEAKENRITIIRK